MTIIFQAAGASIWAPADDEKKMQCRLNETLLEIRTSAVSFSIKASTHCVEPKDLVALKDSGIDVKKWACII